VKETKIAGLLNLVRIFYIYVGGYNSILSTFLLYTAMKKIFHGEEKFTILMDEFIIEHLVTAIIAIFILVTMHNPSIKARSKVLLGMLFNEAVIIAYASIYLLRNDKMPLSMQGMLLTIIANVSIFSGLFLIMLKSRSSLNFYKVPSHPSPPGA